MVEPLSSVSKIRTANHVEDGERSSLKTCVGWVWTGMRSLRRETTANQERLELYQTYIDQLLAEGKATNLTLLKKSWQLNVNAKKRRVKHLVTLTNTWHERGRKKLLALQNVKQRV